MTTAPTQTPRIETELTRCLRCKRPAPVNRRGVCFRCEQSAGLVVRGAALWLREQAARLAAHEAANAA